MAEGLSQAMIYVLMGLMVITGSINTIANKLQQNTVSLGILYEHHQKFITFCMFVGETVCLLLYAIVRKSSSPKANVNVNDISQSPLLTDKTEDKINSALTSSLDKPLDSNMEQKPETESASNAEAGPHVIVEAKFWYYFFPAMCDLVASTLMSIGLTYLASSVYQMLRGILIIFTAINSVIFLKSKIFLHNYLGIFLVVAGLAMVGVNSVINKGSASSNPIAGIILVTVAQMFSSAMYIVEEKLIKKFKAHPLKVVGMEGLWGASVYILLLVAFYFIRCDDWSTNLKEGICQSNMEGEYRFEDAIFAFQQIWYSVQLICYLILYICSIAVFNFVGMSVTKYVSSTARAIVDTVRTIVIWIFFLLMPFVPDRTKETFAWLQLGGFVVLLVGSLIYNEILELPFWGLNKNLKKNLNSPKNEVQCMTDMKKTNKN